MLLAVVDDLLFSSKIRAAAERAGESVSFTRTHEDVVAQVKAIQPGLVIFDLDRDSLDPVAAIREIRSREAEHRTRLVAFARHTSIDRIEAARQAGIDLVLARSAFFSALGEIIGGAGSSGPGVSPPEAS
jgi:DNA-binding NarL/FixJ family response regulator